MPNGTSPHDSSRSTPTKQIPGGGLRGVQRATRRWVIGSFKCSWVRSRPCVRFDASRSVLSCLTRSRRWGSSQAICAGRGTRLPRTSSPRSTPICGSRPVGIRCGCSVRSATTGWRSWPATTASWTVCGSRRRTSSGTSPRTAGTSAAAATGRRRSPTSRPSSGSRPCCRSTPAASGSWPVTTSRPPATSAYPSSASACSTGTATSSSRCRARAGSRRPTPCSTPTGCRSRCSARPTAPGPRSRSRCPTAPT